MSKILDYNNTGKDRSSRDNYRTPSSLYNLFMITNYMDPCPYDENYIINGLTIPWSKKVFVNPPFSNIKGFIQKAIDELTSDRSECCIVWFLVPCNCDTKWFKMAFPYICDLIFVNGRIKFNDSKNGIPTSMILFKMTNIHLKSCCNSMDTYCIHERDLVSTICNLGVL